MTSSVQKFFISLAGVLLLSALTLAWVSRQNVDEEAQGILTEALINLAELDDVSLTADINLKLSNYDGSTGKIEIDAASVLTDIQTDTRAVVDISSAGDTLVNGVVTNFITQTEVRKIEDDIFYKFKKLQATPDNLGLEQLADQMLDNWYTAPLSIDTAADSPIQVSSVAEELKKLAGGFDFISALSSETEVGGLIRIEGVFNPEQMIAFLQEASETTSVPIGDVQLEVIEATIGQIQFTGDFFVEPATNQIVRVTSVGTFAGEESGEIAVDFSLDLFDHNISKSISAPTDVQPGGIF